MSAKASPHGRLSAALLCALAGILSAMSFTLDAEGYVGMSALPASPTNYLWCSLALCFALLFWYLFVRRSLRAGLGACVFGALFGVVNALGGLLFAYDTWAMLDRPTTLTLALLRCAGQALPMIAALSWLDAVLRGGALAAQDERGMPANDGTPVNGSALADGGAPAAPHRHLQLPRRFFDRHPVLSLSLLLALCWLPYLLVFYPGSVSWDLGEMAAQFFGQRPTDTWHPVFTTWLFGGCLWLGRLLGSDNLGAALFTLLQTAALAYALARAVRFLRELRLRRAVWLSSLAFFALTPLWGGYAQFINKDTLYTATLLLFTLDLLSLLRLRESGISRPPVRLLCGLFVWGLLTCLLRSNGLYIILPTALLAVAFAARGRARLWVGGALGGAVAVALLFSNALLPALGVKDETASGLYSVCFQQSARVLRDHPDSVSPEEYAEIDLVLDAAQLPTLYEPWISDPVKFTFRQYGQGADTERAALARYRETWLSMFKKYPLSYTEAFFAGNVSYYAFTPKFEGETYNNQAGNRLVFETPHLGDSQGDDPRFLRTSYIPALEGARTLLAAFARGWRHVPLLSLLYACATYVWLLVGAGLSVARQRRWRILVAFAPALLSLGVCMLSPVNDYFRYFLPIVAMTFPLLGAAGQGIGETGGGGGLPPPPPLKGQ